MNIANKSSKIHPVLLMYSDTGAAAEIEDILSLSSLYSVTKLSFEEAGTHYKALQPELILAVIDSLSDDQIALIKSVRDRLPEASLIVVSKALEDGQIRQLLKLNVHDWLRLPVDKREFHNTLSTCFQTTKASVSRIHGVTSSVGGTGVTTIATTMAHVAAGMLSKQKKSVALVDLDFSTGNCGYVLGLRNTYNLETVIENPSRIDAEFVDLIKHQHEAGFSLYSFKQPDIILRDTSTELVLRMLDAICVQYDHTILDIPYYEVPWKEAVFGAVNDITIVSNLTLPAIKHTQELSKRINAIQNNTEVTSIVFNKYKRRLIGGGIRGSNIKEVFSKFDISNFRIDETTVEEAANRGVLVAEVHERSKFIKDLKKYVKTKLLVEALS